VTRVEWSPDGSRLLAHRKGGVPHVLGLDGELRHEVVNDLDVLDARWDGDYVVVADAGHRLRWYDDRERPREQVELGDASSPTARWAMISAGARYVALDDRGPVVREVPSRRVVWNRRTSSARARLSEDGSRVALTYLTQVREDADAMAFSVHATDTDRALHADVIPATSSLRIAFDAAGKHVVYAAPMPMGPLGVVELGAGHVGLYPEYLAGADAVALDPHGVIAAFASYGQIRFDDLATGAKLVLEVAGAPIAIAFSPDSRSLALLTNDGRVEVLPVP
jgi:hypothetical protein